MTTLWYQNISLLGRFTFIFNMPLLINTSVLWLNWINWWNHIIVSRALIPKKGTKPDFLAGWETENILTLLFSSDTEHIASGYLIRWCFGECFNYWQVGTSSNLAMPDMKLKLGVNPVSNRSNTSNYTFLNDYNDLLVLSFSCINKKRCAVVVLYVRL